ncbi:hypothetical protein Hanom_Chr00s180360g01831711 [Helianthus anomalus]
MPAALDEFRATYNCAFTMVKPCEVLRNSLKWYHVPPVKTGGSSKCSKSNSYMPESRSSTGASDARSYLDFGEPQELPCPPGRDKTKATNARGRLKGKTTSTTTNMEGGSSCSSKLDEKVARILSLKSQEVELEKSRQKAAGIQFLKGPIPTHVSDKDRMIIEMDKQAIRAKYLNKWTKLFF